MNDRQEYTPGRNTGKRQRRNIEFSDRDFEGRREQPIARGLHDEYRDEADYYPEEDYPDDSRYGKDDRYPDDYGYTAEEEGYPDQDRYPDEDYEADDRYNDRPTDREPRQPMQARYPEEERPRKEYYTRESDRDGYRAGYRDGFRDNDPSRSGGKGTYDDNGRYDDMNDNHHKESFRKRHPVMMNLLYAACATVLAVWMALWFLDFWTFHGQERAVPDVKGQSFEMAQGNISRAGLRAVVTDSVYDSYARPGTVVEQSPIPLAKIKRGGTVYLTLVAYTPKMVTIPDFYDVSERQARSMLEGLGITQVMTVNVPSEYAGLVLGAKFNGVSLRPGAKVPVTAVITLEVGGGMEDISPTGEIVDTVAIEQTIEALNID